MFVEYKEENSNLKMNIESFSKVISEKWNVNENVISDYIFASMSLCIARNNEIKKDIVKIYMNNELKYYNLAVNSICINHIFMKQGTLKQEIFARKVLGILLESEINSIVRNKVIRLLKKYYPIVFEAVKKHDKEKLKNKYMKMDIVTRNLEAKFDSSIYLYFSIYIYPDSVDQGIIISILNDIIEFGNIMDIDVDEELKKYKTEIQEVKKELKKKYGQSINYLGTIGNSDERSKKSREFLEELFQFNELNLNHIFDNSKFINIDKIIVSYLRVTNNKDVDLLLDDLMNWILIQSLINEYKESRKVYFEKSGEVLSYKFKELQEKLDNIERENNNLKLITNDLNQEKTLYDKKLNMQLNKLRNEHKLEIKTLNDKIKNLEERLDREKSFRVELESLREYELSSNENHDIFSGNIDLKDYIENKKIIIIGGDKEWRRKFRIKYPQIRTLNGFNENFDTNILSHCDYIFFYTKYMNHSTFHKAMNYIKLNQCYFGYIGKTNIELVEQEIIEKMKF